MHCALLSPSSPSCIFAHMHVQSGLCLEVFATFQWLKHFAYQNHVCTVDLIFASNHDPFSFVSLAGGDGTFLLETSMSKVSVMELVHNGFLYPHETKAVSPKPSI